MNKPKIYLGGDIMTKGSKLAREEEYQQVMNANINADIYSPIKNDSINDKSAMTKEENDHLAEKIVKADIDRLWDSDAVVMCPEQHATGAFAEDKLIELIDHVEATTGKTAVILGSKQAVRKITGIKGAEATSAKEDLYSMGYYGHIGENPVIAMKNAHKVGTDTFVLDPNKLYVVATDDQFVKFVNEKEKSNEIKRN